MTKKNQIIKEVIESLDLAELVSHNPQSAQVHIEEARRKLEKLKPKKNETNNLVG